MDISAASCSQRLPTVAQAQATARTLAARVGCAAADVAGCLRRVPAGKLLAASKGLDFTPVADGRFVPAQPQAAFASGRFAHDSEVLPAATLRQTHHCALWDTIPG